MCAHVGAHARPYCTRGPLGFCCPQAEQAPGTWMRSCSLKNKWQALSWRLQFRACLCFPRLLLHRGLLLLRSGVAIAILRCVKGQRRCCLRASLIQCNRSSYSRRRPGIDKMSACCYARRMTSKHGRHPCRTVSDRLVTEPAHTLHQPALQKLAQRRGCQQRFLVQPLHGQQAL